ncbi:GxxExxY protein [soil metagenome]
MTDDELARIIVQASFDLHRELGPGLLESVYEFLLASALEGQGLTVDRQRPIAISFRGKTFDEGFRADLIVENRILVELKAVEVLGKVHSKQTFTYLRLSNLRVGLLINFGGALLKGNIERIVNGPERVQA